MDGVAWSKVRFFIHFSLQKTRSFVPRGFKQSAAFGGYLFEVSKKTCSLWHLVALCGGNEKLAERLGRF